MGKRLGPEEVEHVSLSFSPVSGAVAAYGTGQEKNSVFREC
jgi:hypothetical protein